MTWLSSQCPAPFDNQPASPDLCTRSATNSSHIINSCNILKCHHYTDIHRVPKLATPLLQMHLIQFVVYGFQVNTVHCTYRHTYDDAHTLPCVLSVTSSRQSLFTLELPSMHCYWQRDQAAAYLLKSHFSMHIWWPIKLISDQLWDFIGDHLNDPFPITN